MYIKREMDTLTRQYNDLTNGSEVTAQVLTGMPHGASKKDGICAYVTNKLDLVEQWRKLRQESGELELKILHVLDVVPDATIQDILYLKYIDDRDEWEISERLGMKERTIGTILRVFFYDLEFYL